MLNFGKETSAQPSAAATESTVYVDSADSKAKHKDGDSAFVGTMTEDGLRGWNAIINGEFDYAQRQVPGTLTTYSQTAARGYTADRWGVTNENLSVQYRQVDTGAAPQTGLLSRYYGEWSKITSTGKIVISQVIESGNCLHFRGRQVRVQLKMKASANKTIRVLLLQLTAAGTIDSIPGYAAGAPSGTFVSAFGANSTDPTFGTNLSKIDPDATVIHEGTRGNTGLSCAVTTAWQRFGGTFTLPTDFRNLVLVIVSDSQFAAADILSIGEVGLYDGPEIREWVPRQQMLQLENCQRYYQKTFNMATLPAQNVASGTLRFWAGQAGAVSFAHYTVKLPVAMRIAPAVTFYNPAAANAFVRQFITPSDATATSATNVNEFGFEITATGLAAWALGQSLGVQYSADAEL
jgi:hypothetical protein